MDLVEPILINEIFGIYFNDENPTILDSKYLTKEWGLPDKQILISGDGHTWISLDFREKISSPIVKYFDLDYELEIQIASSFKEFISKLKDSKNHT